MNVESNRLSTFNTWPASAPVDPPRLARGGFFYTGEGTEVQCFSCNGRLAQWNYGDQVMWRHRLMEPNCTFVAHPSLSGNVALSNYPVPPGEEEHFDSDVTRTTPYYGLTEEDEIYRSDALRLLSFINWEDSSVEALVNAGFYHCGEGRLRCAWCGGELAAYNNMEALGSPLEIHRMYFPRCDHAATLMATAQAYNSSYSSSQEPDTSNDNESQSSGAALNSKILNAVNMWRALGVVGGGARHPTHASMATRINSFQYWPSDRTQTPLALAEAGFFHTGTDDQVDEVRCFYCDGGLGKWEPGDAPWTEHARWFPSCGYVLLVKGQEFVDSCELRPSARRAAPRVQQVSRVQEVPRVQQVPSVQEVPTVQVPADNRVVRNQSLPITEAEINECFESAVGMGALSAGLDAARVKRAISRRLRTHGVSFATSESLIDAVLDEQLNEEAWSVTGNAQTARAFPDEIQPLFEPRHYRRTVRRRLTGSVVDAGSSQTDGARTPSPVADRSPLAISTQSGYQIRAANQDRRSQNNSPRRDISNSPNRLTVILSSNLDRSDQDRIATVHNTPERSNNRASVSNNTQSSVSNDIQSSVSNNIQSSVASLAIANDKQEVESGTVDEKTVSLEEENRQLKESRICKVCMDGEVSVVFLPCGHLVSCARCGAALAACPLCRAAVKALVRAYLA